MTGRKVSGVGTEREVVYDENRWRLLADKRATAMKIMECLRRHGLRAIVHGSVARGDVTPRSDVDVVVTYSVPSFVVELALSGCGFVIYERRVVMATPAHTPKVYLLLDPQGLAEVSFPLARLKPRELEFYAFGGCLDGRGLAEGKRVMGVNKSLELIVPTERGHVAWSILGREEEVARLLGISIETVLERVRVLTRRDEVGRTGVYLCRILGPDESPETVLEELAERNPSIRRALSEREG